MTGKRFYRQDSCSERFRSFSVKVKETDLWLAVSNSSYEEDLEEKITSILWQERSLLEEYIKHNKQFKVTLNPYVAEHTAPAIVKIMTRAGNTAGVGPMASVAGTFAEIIGRYLLTFSPEIMVENGGDIFLKVDQPVKVGIFAGKSSINDKLAISIMPEQTPLGICTSSGTVGPSYSEGSADAVVILSRSASLADAVATKAGNLIKNPSDFKAALSYVQGIKEVSGVVFVCDNHLAVWGDVRLDRSKANI